LGHVELLEYRVKSVYRFLKGREHLFRFEEVLLGYFRRLADVRSREEMVESLRRLRDDLAPLETDPLEGPAFQDFNYMAWLDSQVDGVSFADAVRSRVMSVS
jgi:hypothetical protein